LVLRSKFFQILKIVQGQDKTALAKNSKNGLKTKTGFKDYITAMRQTL